MLRRTHLALGLALAFYFLPVIKSDKLIFFAVVIVASMLPDIESGFSSPGKKMFGLKTGAHKNYLLHTYTLLIPVTIIIALYYPTIALPFFVGYSFHLFIDSFSPQGIRPFWPFKTLSKGSISPGGKIDKVLFYTFVGASALFLLRFILTFSL